MSNEMLARVSVNTLNRERRQPLILLLDASGSMADKLGEVERGLAALRASIVEDTLARSRVEIALVTFGEAVVLHGDFVEATRFSAPPPFAAGATPMAEALLFALDAAREKRAACRAAGIDCFAPWIFLVTDGEPTDLARWTEAVGAVRAAEQAKSAAVFAVGTRHANFERLRQISPTRTIQLRDGGWQTMFRWLSTSLKAKSRSRPGDEVPLEDPRKPDGWALAP